MRGAQIIGKQLVDEAMKLVNSKQAADIRVCKCDVSGAIQRVIDDFKHNRQVGFLLEESHIKSPEH